MNGQTILRRNESVSRVQELSKVKSIKRSVRSESCKASRLAQNFGACGVVSGNVEMLTNPSLSDSNTSYVLDDITRCALGYRRSTALEVLSDDVFVELK